MTPEQTKLLEPGQWLHTHQERNADGSFLRARVNGKPKIWKTRPNEVRVPMKWGLKIGFYIDQDNCSDWHMGDGIMCAGEHEEDTVERNRKHYSRRWNR